MFPFFDSNTKLRDRVDRILVQSSTSSSRQGNCEDGRLPRKLLVVHQFVDSMIADKMLIHADRPEIAVLFQMDAQGPTITKGLAWKDVLQDAPAGTAFGWMNFVTLDEPMLML